MRHCMVMGQPFPKQQIKASSKPKEFADENFKFDENSRKFSKRVENKVEKGEIACYKQFLLFHNVCTEQFLLFPQCFLNT